MSDEMFSTSQRLRMSLLPCSASGECRSEAAFERCRLSDSSDRRVNDCAPPTTPTGILQLYTEAAEVVAGVAAVDCTDELSGTVDQQHDHRKTPQVLTLAISPRQNW